MGDTLLIVLVLIIFAILLALGVHIGTVLIITGVVGILLIDPSSLSGIIQNNSFTSVASYAFTTIPLFILMAQFIMNADIVKYLYNLVYKISLDSGSVLGFFTMILGGFLGAVSGSPTAISATLGQISVPELTKRGYTKNLSGAVAASAGSLSTVIPPSTAVIIYGGITQTSIGELFMGMVIPGILTLLVFGLTTIILFKMTKRKAETSNISIDDDKGNYEKVEEYKTSTYIISISTIVLIMLAIFGGIYLGVFTPTEAGAIGSLITLLAAMLLRKVNFNFIKNSLRDTLLVTVMVLYIIIGASIFGRFITLSLLPQKLVSALEGIIEYPMLLIIILLAVYFLLFMFIEGAAVIVMTAGIALPLATAAGFSSIEFGVLLMVVCTAGLLTPPVGLSVYSVSGVMRTPPQNLFGYTTIFATVMILVVIPLLVIFPELITWIPDSM